MSEDYIQLPPDGTGKKVRAIRRPDNRYEEVMVPYSKDGEVDLKALYSLLEKLTKALATIATDTIRVGGKKNVPFTQREATHELVAQLAHQGTEIDPRVVLREGAKWTHFSLTSSGDIVPAPPAGKKLQLLFFFFSSDSDIVCSLRWSSTGDDMFPLQSRGACGMNLIGAKILEGKENESLYGYLSATGTMKGSVLTQEVPV